MLTLSRKILETIDMYDNDTGKTISVTVTEIARGKVKLGVVADSSVSVLRRELNRRPVVNGVPEYDIDPRG